MARPSKYDIELCKVVCNEIANGKNIKEVLNSKEIYPTFQTWCNWKREHNELFDLYTRSVQDKAEMVDSEIDSIMNDMKTEKISFQIGRVLIDTLKWKAAKYYPKMFGDASKLTLEGGEKPITISFED